MSHPAMILWETGADLADSHDAVSSQDGSLQNVDGWPCDCCPVWEFPFQHIPPAQTGTLERRMHELLAVLRVQKAASGGKAFFLFVF
ncbi:MAG: hypothetical protein FRX49_05242 [Trebouxia sp. A1-2]|nr:MAG: hypothetical protein FRX49_05242 [Trebouxia sp. A1-2]